MHLSPLSLHLNARQRHATPISQRCRQNSPNTTPAAQSQKVCILENSLIGHQKTLRTRTSITTYRQVKLIRKDSQKRPIYTTHFFDSYC